MKTNKTTILSTVTYSLFMLLYYTFAIIHMSDNRGIYNNIYTAQESNVLNIIVFQVVGTSFKTLVGSWYPLN